MDSGLKRNRPPSLNGFRVELRRIPPHGVRSRVVRKGTFRQGWVGLHAMTLTELLVSTALIGIIMLGVVSVEYASKKSQENMSRRSIVTARTSGILFHIAKNAGFAVGDITSVGVQIAGTGDTSYACFRQDIPLTPGNYSDDTWVCYTRRSTNLVHTCNKASPTFCSASDSVLGAATALSVAYTIDSTAQTNIVTISVTSLYNCSASFDTSDPDKNPRVIMTAQASPTGQSFF